MKANRYILEHIVRRNSKRKETIEKYNDATLDIVIKTNPIKRLMAELHTDIAR